MMRMSEAQMHENFIKNTILPIEFSVFSEMAIYTLHLVAFYTVNECKLVDVSVCIHGMKI